MHDMNAKVEIAFSRVFGGVRRRLEGLWLSPSYFLWTRRSTLLRLIQPDAGVYIDNGDVSTRTTLLCTNTPSRRVTTVSISTEIRVNFGLVV